MKRHVVECAKLHFVLGSAEEELNKVQDTLDEFETALRCVVSRIAALRAQSGDIDRHLENRRAVLAELQKAVDSVVVPTDLVETLTDGEINDTYCTRVAELSRLLAPGPYEDCEMRSEVRVVSAMLTSIAAMRIRDFLNAQLATLTRPGTNAQIVQQSVLDRFRVLNHFLTLHAPHFAREIRDTYVCGFTFCSCLTSCMILIRWMNTDQHDGTDSQWILLHLPEQDEGTHIPHWDARRSAWTHAGAASETLFLCIHLFLAV